MPVDDTIADDQWRRYTYCRDRGHYDFAYKADRCDKFVVGEQWLEEDLNALTLQKRPAITINKLLSTISNIQGEQILNRTEVLFRPIAGAPSDVAEALSKVWMQISQNNQLQWVRSDVFGDGIIRSRGFYDVRMNFSDSVFGEVCISSLNSKNVIIDPDAEEYDPDKWNDVFTTKWVTGDDIEVLYSKEDADILRSKMGNTRFGWDSLDRFRDTFAGQRQNIMQYRTDVNIETKRNIRVIDRQYRKADKQQHFVDIATGDMRPIPANWDRNRIAAFLEKTGGQLNVTKKLVKRIRWTVTADDVVLFDDWSPYKHFTVIPYFPHFRYGRTTGIVENLIGPQEILNKVSSQELHIVNTTANSGYIVEEDSLANMTVEELELNGAQTGVVIEYRKGSQPPVKITPNQPPSGLDRISMKTEEHIKTISGVSDSMMGFDRADVAAKAIAYKQQRGSVSLSKILDNLERTDFILARNVLDLIQEFYTDERIINITHDDFAREQEQLTVNQMDPITGAITNDLTLGEYDIVITSSPYRASLEDSQFEQAKALREIGVPIPDRVLIENSRLLRRGEIVKMMEQQSNSPEAQAMQELNVRGVQADVAKKEAEVGKVQANTEVMQAKAAKDMHEIQQPAEQQMDPREEFAAEMEIERQKLELEKYKIDMQMELERYKAQAQAKLDHEKMVRESAMRRAEMIRAEEQQEQQQEQPQG